MNIRPLILTIFTALSFFAAQAQPLSVRVEHKTYDNFFLKWEGKLDKGINYWLLTDEEEFNNMLGLAQTMGSTTRMPDFTTQYVFAIAAPETRMETYLTIKRVEIVDEKDVNIHCILMENGNKQSYTTKPVVVASVPKSPYVKNIIFFDESGKEQKRYNLEKLGKEKQKENEKLQKEAEEARAKVEKAAKKEAADAAEAEEQDNVVDSKAAARAAKEEARKQELAEKQAREEAEEAARLEKLEREAKIAAAERKKAEEERKKVEAEKKAKQAKLEMERMEREEKAAAAERERAEAEAREMKEQEEAFENARKERETEKEELRKEREQKRKERKARREAAEEEE
ncbi:MAG TPA: hypothetical protein VGD89_08205 [Flavipsychrobacter sp.]